MNLVAAVRVPVVAQLVCRWRRVHALQNRRHLRMAVAATRRMRTIQFTALARLVLLRRKRFQDVVHLLHAIGQARGTRLQDVG